MASLIAPIGIWRGIVLNGACQGAASESSWIITSIASSCDTEWILLGLANGSIVQLRRSAEQISICRVLVEGHAAAIKNLFIIKIPHDQASNESYNQWALLSLDENGTVALWSLEDGRCLLLNTFAIGRSHAMGMCLASNQQFVFIYGFTPSVSILRIASLEIVGYVSLPESIWISSATLRTSVDDQNCSVDELFLFPVTVGIAPLKIRFSTFDSKALSLPCHVHSPTPSIITSSFCTETDFYIHDGKSCWRLAVDLWQEIWSDSSRLIINFVKWTLSDTIILLLSDGAFIVLKEKLIMHTGTIPDIYPSLQQLTLFSQKGCKDDDKEEEVICLIHWNNQIKLFDLRKKIFLFNENSQNLTDSDLPSTAISFKNQQNIYLFATGYFNGAIKVTSLNSALLTCEQKEYLLPLEHHSPITALLHLFIMPDRPLLVSGDLMGTVIIWDYSKLHSIATNKAHHSGIIHLNILPTHKLLLVDESGRASLFDMLNLTFFGYLGHCKGPLKQIRYSYFTGNDGICVLKILSWLVNDQIIIWNVNQKEKEKTFHLSSTPNNFSLENDFPHFINIPHQTPHRKELITRHLFPEDAIISSSFTWNVRPYPHKSMIETILFDVRKFILSMKNASLKKEISQDVFCYNLSFTLSLIFPWGLDDELDESAKKFGCSRRRRHVSLGMVGAGGSYCFPIQREMEWKDSSNYSAITLFTLAAILEIPVDLGTEWDNLRVKFHCLIAKLTEAGSDGIPALPHPPSISLLSKYWHDPEEEIKNASRMLMAQSLSSMGSIVLNNLVNYWKALLTSTSDGDLLGGGRSMNRAAIILGIIALHQPDQLDSSTKAMVAESLMSQLMDEKKNIFKSAAIELIGRGYGVWEEHVNALSVFRLLHGWLVGMSKIEEDSMGLAQLVVHYENSATLDLLEAARSTLIKLATLAPSAIIPTWLEVDFCHSRSLIERWTTLSLVSDLVRQRPFALRDHLNEIATMISKMMEMNSAGSTGSSRNFRPVNIVLPLINLLATNYSAFSYHRETMKMVTANTASDNRIHLHDLRGSAPRYFEGHTRPVSALAIAPCGKRLLSYSVEEATLRWWHIPSGLSSLLTGAVKPYHTEIVSPELTEVCRPWWESFTGGGGCDEESGDPLVMAWSPDSRFISFAIAHQTIHTVVSRD